jgi:Tfp pilus assembly protein PilO
MKILAQIFFIAVTIAAFVFYINPTYALIQEKQVEFQRLEDANTKAQELRAKREKLTSDRKKIDDTQLKNLSKFLPDGVENVRLIIDIQHIANKVLSQDIRGAKVIGSAGKTGVAGNGATVSSDGKKYGTIGLTFGVTTTYDEFIVFLQSLEDNLRLVDVTDISFSASDDDKYDFNIVLQTYWLK